MVLGTPKGPERHAELSRKQSYAVKIPKLEHEYNTLWTLIRTQAHTCLINMVFIHLVSYIFFFYGYRGMT